MGMFDFLKQKRSAPRTLPEGTVRRRFRIRGQVQGVGFRYRAKYAAQQLDLAGWVENLEDGDVELEVQGQPQEIDEMFRLIQESDYIRIDDIRQQELTPDPYARGFSVRGY